MNKNIKRILTCWYRAAPAERLGRSRHAEKKPRATQPLRTELWHGGPAQKEFKVSVHLRQLATAKPNLLDYQLDWLKHPHEQSGRKIGVLI